MDSVTKGVTTRRIRRRARIWSEWQAERQHPVSRYVEQLRKLAEPKGKYSFEPRGALTPDQLRAEVEEAFCTIVRNLRDQLRARLREAPHMKAYHREQTIKLVGILRDRPKGREATEIVCAELAKQQQEAA